MAQEFEMKCEHKKRGDFTKCPERFCIENGKVCKNLLVVFVIRKGGE